MRDEKKKDKLKRSFKKLLAIIGRTKTPNYESRYLIVPNLILSYNKPNVTRSRLALDMNTFLFMLIY